MSSELERLLRRAREVLPAPSDDATRRARAGALAVFGRRRLWRRSTLAVGAAIASAVVLGIAVGFVAAPGGTAASGPYGLGFLVEPGWHVLENGGDGRTSSPIAVVAANVPLNPLDDAEGIPLATLQALGPDGVLIVATIGATPTDQPRELRAVYYPPRTLPLRLRDADPFIFPGIQLRPSRPLGQYQLHALVDGYEIDLDLYFGRERPSRALLAEAQRQLDLLVVNPRDDA